MEIHIAQEGRKQGVFSLEQVQAMLEAGQLRPAGTLGWYEGARDWVPLDQVPGIRLPAAPAGAAGVSGRTSPPPLPPRLRALPAVPLPVDYPETGDATAGIIPYKNPQALVGYYLGIFGLIPMFGFFLAIPAVILGVLGRRTFKAHPIRRGSVHAWLAILLGGFSIAYHLAIVVTIFIAASRNG